jgi:hypothetical protein
MKRLKEKTVIQFFIRNGGKLHPDGYWISLPSKYHLVYLGLYRKDALKEGKKEPSLEMHGTRWHKKCNVHIDSYWGWPRTMKDLQRIWNEIRETYGTLCNVDWKSEKEVAWDLRRKKKEQQRFYNLERRWQDEKA